MRTLLLCFGLAACTLADATPKDDPAPSAPSKAGRNTSELRDVAAFHALDVSSVIDVDVTIDKTTRVEISGDADAVAKLETKVENGVLEISLKGHFHKNPKLHATITTPSLDAVDLSGVVNLRASKLAAESFNVSVSGVGTAELSGSTKSLHASLSGSGELRAKELTSAATVIDLSGAGEASVQATKELTASISGVGNVTVYGHPSTVNKTISGVGHLALR